MTSDDYTDAVRYPLTAWPGASAETQALTDACALEGLRAQRRRWNQLTRPQRDQLAELESKAERRADCRGSAPGDPAVATEHPGGPVPSGDLGS